MSQSIGTARRRVVLAAVLLFATVASLTGVGQLPASAQVDEPAAVTQVRGSAFGYYVNVGLFGGARMLRGHGQEGATPEDVSYSPSVQLPSTGSVNPVTADDPDGAAAVYGPATIFGGIWPDDVASAPPSGPMTVSTQGTAAGGSVTSSAKVELLDEPRPVRCVGDPAGTTNCTAPGGFGPGPLIGDVAESTCTADESGVRGSATFTNGILETKYDSGTQLPIESEDIPINPPPNYTRSGTIDHVGDRYTIVFNEQIIGPDSITVNAAHMYLLGATARGDMVVGSSTCSLTSTTPNAAPVAGDDSYTTEEGQPLTMAAPGLLANDTDPNGHALTATNAQAVLSDDRNCCRTYTYPSDPPNGSVDINPDGSFTYTPDPGFHGADTFSYVARDPRGAHDTANVTITVNPLEFVPVAPCAVFDTRFASGALAGKLAGGTSRTFRVTGTVPAGQGGGGCNAPPAGAVAVELNLVALAPEGPGNLRVAAAGVPPQGGVVNFDTGVDNSNALPVAVSGGAVDVSNNTGSGDVHVRGVVLGYYVAEESAGLEFVPVAPCAVFDTRFADGALGGKLAGGVTRTFRVAGTIPAGQGGGGCNAPPAGAVAVALNLVAITPDGPGNLRVAPAGVPPQGGVVNFVTGVDNSNALPVGVAGSAVDVSNNTGSGSVHVRGVVLGYYIEQAPASLEFVPVAPCAVFDTRSAGGKLAGGTSRTFRVTGSVPSTQGGGGCTAPPADAVAVALNLVALAADAPGNLRVAPAGVPPQGGVVNFVAGAGNSNALPVGVAGRAVDVSNNTGSGAVHVRGVVLGYYVEATS